MDKIRRIPLIVGIVLMVLAFLLEAGSAAFVGSEQGDKKEMQAICAEEGLDEGVELSGASAEPPGVGIPSIAFIDVFLLRYVFLAFLGLFSIRNILAKLQGIVSLVLSILVLLGAIAAVFIVIAQLMLKISLLLAVPFGTLAYLAMFGGFAKAAAASVLGIVFLLKLGFGICLLLAQQNFIKSKGLILLFITSLGAGIIVGFLHGIVPMFLASITDDIGAIIVLILGLIWAIVTLIGSIQSVVKAVV